MTHDPSLLSQAHYGGLVGGPGYTAQTVVLLHRLPGLFDDPEFEGCILEGQEDFDLIFTRAGQRQLRLVQCKSKDLGVPDLRDLLDGMYQRDLADPGLYEGFEIVARRFPDRAETVRRGMHRTATTREPYAGSAVEAATQRTLEQRVERMLTGLKCTQPITVDWFLRRMTLNTEIPSFPFQDDHIVGPFALRCADCRQFGVQILAPFRLACAFLHQHLELHRSETLRRADLARIVHDICAAYKDRVRAEGVKIHLDHWRDPDGRACSEADEVFTWRGAYEAARPSGIPDQPTMAGLLGDLMDFERRSRTVWKDARVHLLAPSSVSAALAFGYVFRRTKGYRLSADGADGSWTFDAEMAAGTGLRLLHREQGSEASEAVVGVGVGRDITQAVSAYRAQQAWNGLFVAYESEWDYLNEQQGRRVANAVIRVLRDLHSQGHHVIRFFYAGPMPLAAMVGSMMNQLGRVMIYERDYQNAYQQVFVLDT